MKIDLDKFLDLLYNLMDKNNDYNSEDIFTKRG
jgi:hypothetical protein